MKKDDARITKTKRKVIQAVKDIITAEGLMGLTHLEVARISGISRATLYRHWPTVTDLALFTLEESQLSIEFPHGNDLVWDLATGVHQAADHLSGETGNVLRHLWGMDDKTGYPIERLYQNAVSKLKSCYLHHVPEAHVGEQAWSLAMSLLAGPLFLRWLLRIDPLTDQEIITIAKNAVACLNQASLPD